MPRRRYSKRRRTGPSFGGLSPIGKRVVNGFLLLGGCLLVGNAIVGENGFVDSLKAARQHQQLVINVEELRKENQSLRIKADRLRSDPGAIEEIARSELGFIEAGELVFMVVRR